MCHSQHQIKRKQKRRRILFMIFLVSALFCTCWFPIHSIIFCLKFFRDFPHCSRALYAIKAISHTLIFLNSMLNPFVYTIIGNSFQKKAKEQKLRFKSLYDRSSIANASIRSGCVLRKRGTEINASHSFNKNLLASPNSYSEMNTFCGLKNIKPSISSIETKKELTSTMF